MNFSPVCFLYPMLSALERRMKSKHRIKRMKYQDQRGQHTSKAASKIKLKIWNNSLLQKEALGEHSCTESVYNSGSFNLPVTRGGFKKIINNNINNVHHILLCFHPGCNLYYFWYFTAFILQFEFWFKPKSIFQIIKIIYVKALQRFYRPLINSWLHLKKS